MIGGLDLVLMLADPYSGFAVTPIIDADQQIGEAGIDLRLGPDIIVSKRATGATAFDPSDSAMFRHALLRRQESVRRGIGDPFHLQPGEFVIARSLEYVTLPDDVSAEALGRSSWGRLGLTIATATHVEPGFRGTITLELANVGNTPIVLEIGLRVAQLVFSRAQPIPLDASDAEDRPPPPVMDEQPGDAARQAQQRARTGARQQRMKSWHLEHEARRGPGRYEGQLKPALSRLDEDRELLWVTPLAIRYVIGVVGERYAGKSTVVNYLVAQRGFRLYRLGQLIDEIAQRQGLDAGDPTVLRAVGTKLRNDEEPAWLSKLLFERIRADHLDAERRRLPVSIVIEGFEAPEELQIWQQLDFFHTLLIDTPPADRLARADAGGFLELAKRDNPIPTEGPERLRWLADNVDNVPDVLPHRQLLQAARRGPRAVKVVNDAFGIAHLHATLADELVELEKRWRARTC